MLPRPHIIGKRKKEKGKRKKEKGKRKKGKGKRKKEKGKREKEYKYITSILEANKLTNKKTTNCIRIYYKI